MKNEHDFSKAKKAKAAKELKVIKTFRLDVDILEWLEAEGAKQGMGYQTFLNWFLRKSMDDSQSFDDRLKKIEQVLFKKKV